MSINDALQLAIWLVGALCTAGGVLFAVARYFGRLDTTVEHLTHAVDAMTQAVGTFRKETDERLDRHEARIAHIEGRLGRRAGDTGMH